MYGNTAFDHGHCSISSACIVKDGLHMEQGNYGENFDRGYEEQARPRQQVIVIGEPVRIRERPRTLQSVRWYLEFLRLYSAFCLILELFLH